MDRRLHRLQFFCFVLIFGSALIALRPRLPVSLDPVWIQKINPSSGPLDFVFLQSVERQNEVQIPKAWTQLKWRSLTPNLNLGLHQASKSSVAVDQSGLYVGTDQGEFLALDFNGKQKWKLKSPLAGRGFHGTAVLDESAVYIGDYLGYFWALNKKTGEIFWRSKLGEAIGTSALPVEDDLIVTSEFSWSGNDGLVTRLRRKDGKIKWQSPRIDAQTHSSPSLWPQGHRFFYGDNGGRLFAVDAKSGTLLWTYQAGGEIKNAPLVHEDSIYFGSWSQKIVRLDAESGREIWSRELGGSLQSTSLWITRAEEIFMLSEGPGPQWNFIRHKDGQILWTRSFPVKTRSFRSTPLLLTSPQSQQILVMCGKKEICLLNAVTKKIETQSKIPGEFTGAPAYFQNRIYLSLDQGGVIEISN